MTEFQKGNAILKQISCYTSGGLTKFIVIFFLFNLPLLLSAANKTWSGATSTAWGVATNWVGNSLPGNGDNVLIPGGITNYPVVTANTNFKILTINSSGTGGRVTLNSGTLNASQVFVNAGGLLTMNAGSMTISGIEVTGVFNMLGGNVESSDALVVNNGGVVNQSGGLIFMNANAVANPNDNLILNAGGIYNQTGGTVFFKDILPGTGVFNQTGASAIVKVNRHWKFGAGSVFNSTAGTIQFAGSGTQSDFSVGTRQFTNVIIDAGVNPGFSVTPGSTILISGNFTNNNNALTNTTNASFVFNGSANQTITSVTGTGTTFGNLTIDKSAGVVSLLSNCYVAGNTTITNGTYDLSTFISNRGVAGGTLTVSAGATLKVGGTTGGITGSNFPLNFTVNTLSPTSTVHYSGANQTVASFSYGHLTLSGNGGAVVKTFPATALIVAGNLITQAGTSTSVTANAAAIITVSGNVNIGSGTILSGGAFNHTINGNFVVNGTYNHSAITYLKGNLTGTGGYNGTNETLEMNGLSMQTMTGVAFTGNNLKNLTVNNSSGVLLTGNLNVTAIVKVTQGDFNSGGLLTLASTATQTALIDGSGAGSVSGVVTLQRYIPAGFGYKYFSSPFLGATVNEFSDDLNLAATFPPFYRYNESSTSSGWVNYSNTSGVLQPLTGYAANFGTGTVAVTADISGTVNNSPQTITLYNTNKQFTTGFNLVGNPYPSPVNWDAAAGWNRVNIDNAVYYFDASSSDQYGGTYNSYINGVSSNGSANGIIPAMQGFFVHVSNGTFPVTATLGINNAARTTNLQPLFHRILQTVEYPTIRMQASFLGSGNVKDALVVYMDDSATPAFDKEKDALKIMNTDSGVPSIYSFGADQSRLSISALPDLMDQSLIIPLGIQTDQGGVITFNCNEIALIPDSIQVYLSDSKTRINHNLRLNPECNIQLDQGTHDGRFRLILTTSELPYITDTDEFGVYSVGETIFIYVNPGDGESGYVSISNLQGQTLLTEKFSEEGHYTLTPEFSNGIYVVSFYTNKSSFSKKLFLTNN